MTVRNIRAHQSRGLLQPPEVRARTGYYGADHMVRLRLISEMQADGFNLEAIKRLVTGGTGPAAELVLGLKHALAAPFQTEEPDVLTWEDLAERFGGEPNPKNLAKAEKLGALRPLGEGRWEAPSPALLHAAEEVMSRGVSLAAALRVVEQLNRHSKSVARTFVDLFLEEVWKPFEEAGHPEERWPDVVESIERLRPIASEALLAVFQQTMTAEVESAFGKVVERQAKRGR